MLRNDNANSMKKSATQFTSFDAKHFDNPSPSSTLRLEHVTAADISRLAEQTDNLVLLFWAPYCPSTKKDIKLAEHLDSLNIPYILMSPSYHIKETLAWFKEAKIRNKTIYVMSSAETSYSNKIVVKRLEFLKDICNECYQKHRDDLMFYSIVQFGNAQTPTIYNHADFYDYLKTTHTQAE